MNNFQISIKRAKKANLYDGSIEKYLLIKILPIEGGCCCFHCWPETWKQINKKIKPYGILEDEGDILISDKNGKFVLECHETGPEIIVYLGIGIATLNLAKSIFDLVNTIIKNRQNEKKSSSYKIQKRYYKNGKLIEDDIFNINGILSKDNEAILLKTIEKLLSHRDN